MAVPSSFAASDEGPCQLEEKCDRYQLLLQNVGEAPSSGPVTVTDQLPAGVVTRAAPRSEGSWQCAPNGAGAGSVVCTLNESVPAGHYAPFLEIGVQAPGAGLTGVLRNEVTVAGGGAPLTTVADAQTPVNALGGLFGVSEFGFAPVEADGAPAALAGGHPWSLTTDFGITTSTSPAGVAGGESGRPFTPVRQVKSAIVEFPVGLVGDPQATEKCTEAQLHGDKCPAGSRIGTFSLIGGAFAAADFEFTEAPGACCSAVYNMVPQAGYPAQFAFTYAGMPVSMYVSFVHSALGYRLRAVIPGIPEQPEVYDASITLFGEPGMLNGTGSEAAFLTNPSSCAAGSLASTIELKAWSEPGRPVSREAPAYPPLAGCQALRFAPTLSLAPSAGGEAGTTQADAPSAYTVDLRLPQSTTFSEPATPGLKNAAVTFAQGVALSPATGQGLVGCEAQGPEGINLGSGEIGSAGQDLGDPEATELGAGHAGPGGTDSPYDDGIYHTAPGHCPAASTLGTVEIATPLLPAPLQGHIYLAEPQCGGAGAPPCTEGSAGNGQLFGLYLQAEGSGVIVKLAGTLSASTETGQLTVSFEEDPQLPLSEIQLHFHGGPRAPLANPQTCGTFTSTSDLTPWSAPGVTPKGVEVPGTPDATPTSSFGMSWDGGSGACPARAPFLPAFTAGTAPATAGGASQLMLTISRADREQDLSELTFTTPPGVTANLSSVTPCIEPAAARGDCPQAARLGTVIVAAGSGSAPIYLNGDVYLTGSYNGEPYGLSIVVPAEVGPFHLGKVIIRASIAVNPATAALTISTGALPQIVDGIPLRIRTLHVTLDRPGFILNPTNCSQQQVTGTLTAAQGATSKVSSPFAVVGCRNLPFTPKLTALTSGNGEFAGHGASLHVKIITGDGQANMRSLKLDLPQRLPARLETIQKACRSAVFNTNPAACPKTSVIGSAIVATPVLGEALRGPAILVSHGGKAFPDMVLVLQAQGVRIDLTGALFVDRHNITSTTFRTLPDVPIRRLDLVLPEGKNSVLAASASLCAGGLHMLTAITGQNNARVKPTVEVAVAGCKHRKKRHHKSKRPPAHGRRATLPLFHSA